MEEHRQKEERSRWRILSTAPPTRGSITRTMSGGEITERFTFAVDWGDGTEVDSGLATIDVPGGAGVPTAGSFDRCGTPTPNNGIYTVTVTISDRRWRIGQRQHVHRDGFKNVAPTLEVPGNQNIDEGATLTLGEFRT